MQFGSQITFGLYNLKTIVLKKRNIELYSLKVILTCRLYNPKDKMTP